jgi:hypothetical protein
MLMAEESVGTSVHVEQGGPGANRDDFYVGIIGYLEYNHSKMRK